jgi:hypothetical protein
MSTFTNELGDFAMSSLTYEQRRQQQFNDAFDDAPSSPEHLEQSIKNGNSIPNSGSFQIDQLSVESENEDEEVDFHSANDEPTTSRQPNRQQSDEADTTRHFRAPTSPPRSHLRSLSRFRVHTPSPQLRDPSNSQTRTPPPQPDSHKFRAFTSTPQRNPHSLFSSRPLDIPKLAAEVLAQQQAALKKQHDDLKQQKSAKKQRDVKQPTALKMMKMSDTRSQAPSHKDEDEDEIMFIDEQAPSPASSFKDDNDDDEIMFIDERVLKVTHDNDDDSDIMMIDEQEASPTALSKWQQHRFTTKVTIDPTIKQEPMSIPAPVTPPPKENSLDAVLAAQRALLAQINAPKTVPGNSSGWRDETEGSGSEDNGEPGYRCQSPDINPIYRENRENAMQVDAALLPGNEDNSWMEQVDEVDEEFEMMKSSIAKLKAKKKLNHDEDMQLFKLEKQFQVKQRLRSAAESRGAADEDDELFVTQPAESRNEIIQRHRRNHPALSGSNIDEDFNDDIHNDEDAGLARMLREELNGGIVAGPSSSSGQDLGLTKSGKPRKRRARNAREVVAQEEERREKERSKFIKKVCPMSQSFMEILVSKVRFLTDQFSA